MSLSQSYATITNQSNKPEHVFSELTIYIPHQNYYMKLHSNLVVFGDFESSSIVVFMFVVVDAKNHVNGKGK